jgi:hypothetical protein
VHASQMTAMIRSSEQYGVKVIVFQKNISHKNIKL